MKIRILSALLALSLAAPVFATESSESSLTELLAVSGAERQYAQMCEVLAQNIQAGFNMALSRSLEGKPVDEKGIEVIQRHARDLGARYSKQLQESMPWPTLAKEVYIPLYQKHFSQEEVAQLVAFYRSDAGKKFSEKAPDLIQEASTAVNMKYTPALITMSTGLIQEKLADVMRDLGVQPATPEPECQQAAGQKPKCEDEGVPPRPVMLKE